MPRKNPYGDMAADLLDLLCRYKAHESQADAEGMRIATEGMADCIERLMPGAKAVTQQFESPDAGLKCPECDDWTWSGFTVRRGGRVAVQGECGHSWPLVKSIES
jgi:hypothetical protein